MVSQVSGVREKSCIKIYMLLEVNVWVWNHEKQCAWEECNVFPTKMKERNLIFENIHERCSVIDVYVLPGDV